MFLPLLRCWLAVLAFVALPGLCAGLNDTGVTACGDASTTSAANCAAVAYDGGPFPRQDAVLGRDAQAAAGQITKIGTGAAGFDFSKIGNNGTLVGVGAVRGANPTDWACTKDNVSGLIWEEKTDAGLHSTGDTFSWYQAGAGVQNGGTCNSAGHCDTQQFVADVNAAALCGYTDWRLPTLKDLENIVNYSTINPAVEPTYFGNTATAKYWTTTPEAGRSPPQFAWDVDFSTGGVFQDVLATKSRVRLVRGIATPPHQFTNNNDGTITDSATGLMWKQDHELLNPADRSDANLNDWPVRINWFGWQDALQRATLANTNKFAGYSDWRLPNVKELRSLVDETRQNPTIDTTYFLSPPFQSYFWSSSPAIDFFQNTNLSWYVDLYTRGASQAVSRSNKAYVRLVRNSSVSLSPGSLGFGTQNLLSTSGSQTLTFSNNGLSALNNIGITASGDYARTTTCGATLTAGANCTITVNFTPTAVGTRPGSITITSDIGGTLTASLTGTGAATLGITKTGAGVGTVTSDTGGINCGAVCSASFVSAASVTLTATPTQGSTFTGWSGAGCTGTGTCIVTMSQAQSVTANFAPSYTLTLGKSGSGSGTVTSGDGSINCGSACSALFASGASVTLTATSAAGSTFTGWSGACTNATGTCTVSMTAAQSVTATFALSYTLTLSKAATGSGTVTSDTGGLNCGATCSASFVDGTVVTLTATHAAGSTFTGWSGAGCTGTGTCIVTMSQARSVAANFASLGYSAISAGGLYTLALKTDSSLWAWGWNGYGQLGDGSTINASSPKHIGQDTDLFAAIAAGFNYSVARKADGSLWAWGWNYYGQLGDGSNIDSSTPKQIGTAFSISANKGISAGSYHTVAVKTDGSLWAWGRNDVGQLGNGSNTASNVPVAVTGLGATPGVSASAAGDKHSCALINGGTVKCWGLNADGQLGNGSNIASNVPVAVTGLSGVSAIATGYNHSCALIAGGTVMCWGLNADGQLGNATNTDSNVPVAVTGLSGVLDIAAGYNHSCALITGGTVKCWGLNTYGELGNNTNTDSNVPVLVSGLTGATAISAGSYHNVALQSDGSLWSWGWNVLGQLGDGTTLPHKTPELIGTAPQTLSVVVSGSGTVSSSPSGIAACGASCNSSFAGGTSVTLTATPTAGSAFAGWSGACTNATGTCTVSMTAAQSVTATFAPSYTLTLGKSGAGSGTVTSGDGSINCGSTCSANFAGATSVTLTATPAAGSSFAGWSGACTNATGTCTVSMTAAQSVTATFALSYTLTVGKSGTGSGTVTSDTGGINCGSACSANFAGGTAVTLTAAATAGSTFTGWSGACTNATGTCVVSMTAAQSVTATFALSSSSRLSNLSTRGQVQTGNNVMIGGFIIGGASPKTVLVRAIGPTLGAYGVTGVLANPTLQLLSGSNVIASNDDWQTASNAVAISNTGLAPANIVESAILTTLNPGAYTAIVSGLNGVSGVGMVEVYEIDHPEIPLTNISTRGQVQTGNNVMIGGFVINGSTPKNVLVRAIGPSLAAYGVAGVLANPTLQLLSGSNVIASNDDWGTASNAAAITASGLAPTNSLESAILTTLNPGAYTAIVSGVGGTSGVGMVEVYVLP